MQVRNVRRSKAGMRPRIGLIRSGDGAPGQIRTAGTRFRRAVLYPLSYGGDVAFFNHDHQV